MFEKVQGDLYILQLVEAHPSFLPRLQETRGRQTSGGGNAWGQNDQQTARPHDRGTGVSVSTFRVQNKDLIYCRKILTVMEKTKWANLKRDSNSAWLWSKRLARLSSGLTSRMTPKCINKPARMSAGESMKMNDTRSQWFPQSSVTILVFSETYTYLFRHFVKHLYYLKLYSYGTSITSGSHVFSAAYSHGISKVFYSYLLALSPDYDVRALRNIYFLNNKSRLPTLHENVEKPQPL